MKLCFPEKILSQHFVLLGKTGAGKSSALRHVVEHLLDQGKRVVVIDPKGDWWGLKTSADGKSAGYPVTAFGDFKEAKAQDVPLNAQSGKIVADLVATGNRPCIIGFRGWMPSAMTRFWIDFASTLFNQNAGELYLIIDEVHNFAAKGKIMDPEAGKCLHWTNRIMAEGRGVGIVAGIASQRPQKVHNDTLTSCETLMAMRVIHAADRQALSDWIDGCGDPAKGRELLAKVASLPRGEAFVWSPEISFGPERVHFPLFETFDSFAPPQLQRRVAASGWGTIDLNNVRTRMARVIEEMKANDPKELRAEIARLKAVKPVETKVEVREVPVFTKEHIDLLAGTRQIMNRFSSQIEVLHHKLMELERHVTQRQANLPTKAMLDYARKDIQTTEAAIAARDRPVDTPATIGGGMRRMMIALAQRPGLDRRQLGIRAQLAQSGTFDTYLARMRSAGYMEGGRGEAMFLTPEGIAALGTYERLPEGQALLEHWLGKFGESGAAKMLRALAEHYPNSMARAELAEVSGLALSGTFDTYLSRLRALELIEGRGEMRASPEFFT